MLSAFADVARERAGAERRLQARAIGSRTSVTRRGSEPL